ncbi:chemotaxis response regulator protein-glutamate methylesterase [Lacibacterium aquatile]|uniref:Protein-glutamate methylesterase/protein-glutamine glutaminase n=1 Tax=Lacibacterium aquatile TaxID=1168082 RepID=A0ABW5DPE8_9PROT
MASDLPAPATGARDGVIRVMLVDDSAVIRGLFTRALEADPELQVVASVGDGKMAVAALKRTPVDIIILDIEMPVMDGLTALPLLKEVLPEVRVIMASTLTRKNAEVSLRAMRDGAADYVTKPSSTSELTSAEHFKQELIAKIKALVGSRRSPRLDRPGMPPRPASVPPVGQAATAAVAPAGSERHPLFPRAKGGPLTLRPMVHDVPEVIAIGSSTGGPQALFQVLGNLPKNLRQPILITQHMPATFTTILAEHLTRIADRPCSEAVDGQVLQPGHIYVAPGDFHMIVESQGTSKVLRLLKTPPENFCRPAVDPMLRSLAAIYGRRLLVIILTGMGQDGMRGSDVVVQSGGMIIGQDEASSVVWGMPGAVATAGLCSQILPLSDIGPFILKQAMRTAA